MAIKNIIFDLGGVIININVALAFANLCNQSATPIRNGEEILHKINHLFEAGQLNEASFIATVKESFHLSHLSDIQITQLWNNVLLDIPVDRIHLLHQLKEKYRIFLLSNTNTIHLKGVNKILFQTSNIHNINEIFEKCYYSFDLNLRKPDPKIFQLVLDDSNLLAEETLFIDDTHENAESAAFLGIKSIYLCAPLTLQEALKDYV